MDRRVTLQEPTVTVLASGQKSEAFTDRGTVWARLEIKQGKEGYEAEKLTSTNTVDWIIRYRSDIKPDWQLVHNTLTYTVIAVQEAAIKQEFSRKRFLRIITEQKF